MRLCLSHKHLQTLFHEGAVGALSDGELLERFTTRRGEAAEAAFAVLVERHAPMVLATCRQILGDVHDAEDASQAAFLVLAKKARTIRSGQAIGGWLHAVAVRIASKAKVAAARRRKREVRSADMAVHRSETPDPADRWAELHRQIDRLPDRFRLPIVLCYLEGLTHAEAAHHLGWPVGTVESRLARGRERLKERLTARDAMAMIPSAIPAAAPPAWIAATARAATRFAAGDAATAVASANVASMAGGMIRTMGWHQAGFAIGGVMAAIIVATGAVAAFRVGSPETPLARHGDGRPTVAAADWKADTPAPAPATIQVNGRVLDPDGRPLAGAKLWLAFQGTDWTWSTRVPQVRTTSGPDGRFDLTVSDDDPEVKRALRMTSGMPGGFGAIQLVATAEGFGPCWIDLAGATGDVELRLVRDDVPIEGRLINLEGRPIPGVEVRTLLVEDPKNKECIFGAPSGYFQAATTDADGRFRLAGIGRDRRAVLGIAGLGIQRDGLQVVTGSFPKDRPPIYATYPVYAAKLEHPCKPGKAIAGVVRDIDTGKPLAGIRVGSSSRGRCSYRDRPGRPLPARGSAQGLGVPVDRLRSRERPALYHVPADGPRQRGIRAGDRGYRDGPRGHRDGSPDRPGDRAAGAGLGRLCRAPREPALGARARLRHTLRPELSDAQPSLPGRRHLSAGRAAGPRVPGRIHPVSSRSIHPGRHPIEATPRRAGRRPRHALRHRAVSALPAELPGSPADRYRAGDRIGDLRPDVRLRHRPHRHRDGSRGPSAFRRQHDR